MSPGLGRPRARTGLTGSCTVCRKEPGAAQFQSCHPDCPYHQTVLRSVCPGRVPRTSEDTPTLPRHRAHTIRPGPLTPTLQITAWTHGAPEGTSSPLVSWRAPWKATPLDSWPSPRQAMFRCSPPLASEVPWKGWGAWLGPLHTPSVWACPGQHSRLPETAGLAVTAGREQARKPSSPRPGQACSSRGEVPSAVLAGGSPSLTLHSAVH